MQGASGGQEEKGKGGPRAGPQELVGSTGVQSHHTCPVCPVNFVLLAKDSPCILVAAMTSPAEMLDTLTK